MSPNEIAQRLLELETAFGLDSETFAASVQFGHDLSAYTYGGESLACSPLRAEWIMLLGFHEAITQRSMTEMTTRVTFGQCGPLFLCDRCGRMLEEIQVGERTALQHPEDSRAWMGLGKMRNCVFSGMLYTHPFREVKLERF